MPNPNDYSIVLRFLGTTPATSNITNCYNSIIYQIARLFNLKMPNQAISNKQALRFYLLEQLLCLATNYPNKRLVIILDSIDQLVSLMNMQFDIFCKSKLVFLEHGRL